jgi:hypothetical protein
MSKGKCAKAREKAWRMFSVYIKLRDANENGVCECCTCGRRLDWDSKDCHAGHFIPGRSNAVLLDPAIVHAQCSSCNFNDGEQARYFLFMKRKYGFSDSQMSDILTKSRGVQQVKEHQFLDKVTEFWQAVSGMLFTKFKDNSDMEQRVKDKLKKLSLTRLISS